MLRMIDTMHTNMNLGPVMIEAVELYTMHQSNQQHYGCCCLGKLGVEKRRENGIDHGEGRSNDARHQMRK